MERYVAIDNVCAWPNLTLFDNGHIGAVIFNQPCHGLWEGDVECWKSEDAGRIWKKAGVVAPHEPNTVRMNVAAGLTRDGAFIVLASGWDHKKPKTAYDATARNVSKVIAPWVCRSDDQGCTWTQTPLSNLGKPVIPFGDIIHAKDGTLGVSVYGDRSETAYFLKSRDDGRTWSGMHVIGADDYNETDLYADQDGTILAVSRRLHMRNLTLFRSTDHGRCWQSVSDVSLPNQHPAHIMRLHNGKLLLTYGLRNPGSYGVGVRVSSDNGKTFGMPAFLVNLEQKTDCGYPSSVQTADGTIVTAYYAGGIAQHNRYHMGVVRWTEEELFD